MTTAKTTFNRATEENQQVFNQIGDDVLFVANHSSEMSNDEIKAALSRVFWDLSDLKPYLFPETNKVNY